MSKITLKTLKAVCLEANTTVFRAWPFGVAVHPEGAGYMVFLLQRKLSVRTRLLKEPLSPRVVFWFLDGFIQQAVLVENGEGKV